MGFHKLTYPIAMIPAYVDRTGNQIEYRTGWTDENYQFGFFNNGKSFTATDLRTGRVVTNQKTRKACVEWIENNMVRLVALFATDVYAQWVEEFEAAKGVVE